jgi:hypothetical protein
MVGLSQTAAAFFKVRGTPSITYWPFPSTLVDLGFFVYKFLLILLEFSIVETLFNFFLATTIRNGGTAILLSSLICLAQMAYAGQCQALLVLSSQRLLLIVQETVAKVSLSISR